MEVSSSLTVWKTLAKGQALMGGSQENKEILVALELDELSSRHVGFGVGVYWLLAYDTIDWKGGENSAVEGSMALMQKFESCMSMNREHLSPLFYMKV